MDDALIAGTAITGSDRLLNNIPAANISLVRRARADLPADLLGVLTTVMNSVPPIFVGIWGAVDLIRDPYSEAESGALRLTALATMDVNIFRAAQIKSSPASITPATWFSGGRHAAVRRREGEIEVAVTAAAKAACAVGSRTVGPVSCPTAAKPGARVRSDCVPGIRLPRR